MLRLFFLLFAMLPQVLHGAKMREWQRQGVITGLNVAMSREGPKVGGTKYFKTFLKLFPEPHHLPSESSTIGRFVFFSLVRNG